MQYSIRLHDVRRIGHSIASLRCQSDAVYRKHTTVAAINRLQTVRQSLSILPTYLPVGGCRLTLALTLKPRKLCTASVWKCSISTEQSTVIADGRTSPHCLSFSFDPLRHLICFSSIDQQRLNKNRRRASLVLNCSPIKAKFSLDRRAR